MNKENKEGLANNKTIKYNDLGIRIVLSILAAHIMSAYNEPEGFFEIILSPSYIRGLIASFIIAFLIVNLIYYVTIKLNKIYIWHEQTLQRFLWQVVLGFLAPAVVVFLLVTLFFSLYSINVFHTEYITQDYPLVLMMLLCINLYYFGLHYFLLASNRTYHKHENFIEIVAEPVVEATNSTNTEKPTDASVHKETLIITTSLKTFPVSTDDIAYIFRINDGVFIRLKTMKSLSESYMVNYSLKELESLLDPSLFFRINRQMIVSYGSVESFRNESAKTLFLFLSPPLFTDEKSTPTEYKKLPIVSESKTPKFKIWMNR